MIENPIVTLTTEYGLRSPYPAVLKGALLSLHRNIQFVDISHEISPNDILSAAYLLRTSSQEFPPETIHLIGVDMNPVRYGQILIAQSEGRYFVGADNGIFSLVFSGKNYETFALNLEGFSFSKIFPEKDIFPYIVDRLIRKDPLESYAKPVKETNQLQTLSPVIFETSIKGRIVFIDGYENVITDISWKDIEKFKDKKKFEILYRRKGGIRKLSEDYHDDKNGEVMALINSFGYLEIAIRRGNAKSLLGLQIGGNIIVEFND